MSRALGCALAGAVVLALPAGAEAAPVASDSGATVTLKGAAASGLRAQGVRVSAVAPARLRGGTRVSLPVTALTLPAGAARAQVSHRGALRFRARVQGRTRSVTVGGWRTALGGRSSSLSAVVAGRRVTVFSVATSTRTLAISSSGARVSGARLRLTAAGAKAIARRLGLRRVRAGAFGTLTLTAALRGTTPPASPAPATPTTPSAGTPATTPITDEPPLLARPATAVAVTGASITWRVRDSFVQYLNAGTAANDGASAIAPATSDPLGPGCTSAGTVNDAQLTYQFHFPFAQGWYDPVSGTAALYYTGSVHFGYRSHTIDLTAADPEIELNGAASRVIMRFSGSGGTDAGNKRAAMMDLAPSRAPVAAACSADPGPAGAHQPAGVANADGTRTYTYERVPGVIPESATSSLFAGFYLAGDPFGWLTVSFTTAA